MLAHFLLSAWIIIIIFFFFFGILIGILAVYLLPTQRQEGSGFMDPSSLHVSSAPLMSPRPLWISETMLEPVPVVGFYPTTKVASKKESSVWYGILDQWIRWGNLRNTSHSTVNFVLFSYQSPIRRFVAQLFPHKLANGRFNLSIRRTHKGNVLDI